MKPFLTSALGDYLFKYHDMAPKQLGISSTQINYWVDRVMLPFVERPKKEKGKRLSRIRLNLANAVWAGIIKELLDTGVSSKRLEKLAKDVWHEPRKKKYADKVINNAINQKKGPLTKEDIESLKKVLSNDMLMNTLRTEINPFTDMIKSCLVKRKLPHSLIYVPKTGKHKFLMNEGDLLAKLSGCSMESSLLIVPLLPIISKVVASDFFTIKKDLDYLTDIEQQIRDIVVFKKPKYLEIAFENDTIKPIVITEEHKTGEQLANYILTNKIAKGSKLLIDIRSQDNYKITLISK